MEPPTTPTFTPARIVALALIAVLACGLAYLRFGPDGGSVSVPAGAKAGDLTLAPLQLRAPRTGATQPTAARSSCPRTAPTRSRG